MLLYYSIIILLYFYINRILICYIIRLLYYYILREFWLAQRTHYGSRPQVLGPISSLRTLSTPRLRLGVLEGVSHIKNDPFLNIFSHFWLWGSKN